MSLTPTEDLIDALNETPSVASAVTGKIWLGIADQDAPAPFGVVKLLDGSADVICQGDQAERLHALYEVLIYAETDNVAAVRSASDITHAAMKALARGAVFNGWRLVRKARLRRVIERPVTQEGEVRWHARGAVYELDFSEE